MRGFRLWSLLLLPGGVAAGHALGYSAAALVGSTPSVEGGHGYLTVMFRLAVPFTLAVLARGFLSGARAELPPVRFGALAGQQVALFVLIELFEHLRAGIWPAQSLTEASFVLGIAAQLAVAAALVWLVGWMRRAGELVAGRRVGSLRRRVSVRVLRSCGVVAPQVVVWSLSRRGPPLSFVV